MKDKHRTRLIRGILTVDVVLFTRRGGRLFVLAVERGKEPFRTALALPGGFVNPGERTPDAAVRELGEETGLAIHRNRLRRLGFYDKPGRDPRGPIASVVYHGYTADAPAVRGAGDAQAARWLRVAEFLAPETSVAFDHREIVAEATARRFGRLSYPSNHQEQNLSPRIT
ncbi:NUDIX domain-containing protein [Actinophytocola oryzae]|uniref:ADP-ribose pyrophosphatase YjhB (NUDIX family) n=1 Tax=Actinophytocola oryzae TaxID=502181 RepID=A0A4R7UTX8_9PSEU|nr:NUDIX hydrolase [Actinophytocola oryzae]TDV40128.1 ADP-ribose pyrophosphatase YjhB (NUDIX family) [Actinophytocola oryzae]